MSWAKVDDRLFSHPKFLQASLAAKGLWLVALSYAASLERDGWFPASGLQLFAPIDTDTGVLANELVALGLWLRDADGYRFHDYLRYNISANRLKKKRKATAKRMRALRERDGVTDGVTARAVTRLPARPGPSCPEADPEKKTSLRSAKEKGWKRVPEHEQLTDARLADGRRVSGLFATEVRQAWDGFCDYEFYRPRHDVDAAWRNWCRKSRPQRQATGR